MRGGGAVRGDEGTEHEVRLETGLVRVLLFSCSQSAGGIPWTATTAVAADEVSAVYRLFNGLELTRYTTTVSCNH